MTAFLATAPAAVCRTRTRSIGVAAGAALVGLATLTAASYLYAARAPMPELSMPRGLAFVQAALFAGGAAIVLRARVNRATVALILATGILCRTLLVPGPPRFSTDVYRYVWDGRVQAAGINPYRYVPADAALAGLRDAAVYPRINRKDYGRTIYPPVAQLIFLAVTRAGATVTVMKAAMAAFDGVTMWMLLILLGRLGLPRARVLLYAWNPLVIWQYAGDGHVDAAAVAFVALALVAHVRHRDIPAGIALGCATLVKWYPALLFPALYRRPDWKMPVAMAAVMAAAYAPYVGAGAGLAGFMPGYVREEGLLTGHRFFLLNVARAAGAAVPPAVYLAAALAALLVIGVRASRGPERTPLGDLQGAAMLAAAFTIFLSTHYLWYFGWLAVFLAVLPSLPMMYLAAAPPYLLSAFGFRQLFGIPGIFVFDTALYAPLPLLAAADFCLTRAAHGAAALAAGALGRIGGPAPAGTEP